MLWRLRSQRVIIIIIIMPRIYTNKRPKINVTRSSCEWREIITEVLDVAQSSAPV